MGEDDAKQPGPAPRTSQGRASSSPAELAHALAWPLVALVAIVAVGGPVRTLVERAVDFLGASSKMSYGSFSLEIDRAAASQGDPKLGALIKGLSSSAIRVLMKTGDAKMTNHGDKPDGLDELREAGLVEVTQDSEKEQTYQLTNRGKTGFTLIVDAISQPAGSNALPDLRRWVRRGRSRRRP
jgi:DNA-binding transcriptional ArsR family regulator